MCGVVGDDDVFVILAIVSMVVVSVSICCEFIAKKPASCLFLGVGDLDIDGPPLAQWNFHGAVTHWNTLSLFLLLLLLLSLCERLIALCELLWWWV